MPELILQQKDGFWFDEGGNRQALQLEKGADRFSEEMIGVGFY